MASISKSDIKEILDQALDEKIGAIENEISNIKSTMTAQYLNSIARLLEQEAKERVGGFNCSYHEATETACKSSLSEYIGKYTNALAMGDLPEAFAVLNEFEQEAKSNAADLDKGVKCKQDWFEIAKIISRHKEVAKDLSAQFTARKVPADIGDLDFSPEELYDDVVFPLSHVLRIKIIHSLKSGSKRFTTLKNELDVKNTGLLVHHLKPLTEASLVEQDFKGAYMLTDSGFLVARYLAQIAAAMYEDRVKTITIGNSHPSITELEVVND